MGGVGGWVERMGGWERCGWVGGEVGEWEGVAGSVGCRRWAIPSIGTQIAVLCLQ